MSSSEFFEGQIEIVPPLNFAEIQKAKKIALTLLPPSGWERKHSTEENVFESYMPLKFDLEVFDRPTDEGVLQVTKTAFMRPTNTSGGCYSGRVKPLLEALIKFLPGHNWSGEILSINEDRGDALKVTVTVHRDTSVVGSMSGKGFVKWSDGTLTEMDDITG